MKRSSITGFAGILCLAVLLGIAVTAGAQAQDGGTWVKGNDLMITGEENMSYAALLAEKSPCIVSVRMVLDVSVSFRGRDQEFERETETQGAVIDPSGIVVISSAVLGGGTRELSDQGGMKTTPVDIKVIPEGGEEEYEASVVVTDTNLGLTYLKVKGLGGKKLPALVLGDTATVSIGMELIGVSRHGKGFDYAPFFDTVRVSGRVEQPRPCWSLAGGFRGQGLPLFDLKGRLAGFVTALRSAGESAGRGAAAGGGGRRPGGRGMPFSRNRAGAGGGVFLTPAAAVKANLSKVLEMAAKAKKEKEG